MRTQSCALAMILLALAACGKEEPLPQYQGSATAAPGSEQGTVVPVETAPTTVPTTQPAGGGGAPIQAIPSGAALATTEGEVPDVRIDITQFKRDTGGTVTLRFVLVNNSNDRVGFGSHWMGDNSIGSDYYSVGGVHLIDPINKKKYFVVRDSDRTCLCSRELSAVDPGKRSNLWAKFPAPPTDVQRLTVVFPHFTPLDDVPLS